MFEKAHIHLKPRVGPVLWIRSRFTQSLDQEALLWYHLVLIVAVTIFLFFLDTGFLFPLWCDNALVLKSPSCWRFRIWHCQMLHNGGTLIQQLETRTHPKVFFFATQISPSEVFRHTVEQRFPQNPSRSEGSPMYPSVRLKEQIFPGQIS